VRAYRAVPFKRTSVLLVSDLPSEGTFRGSVDDRDSLANQVLLPAQKVRRNLYVSAVALGRSVVKFKQQSLPWQALL